MFLLDSAQLQRAREQIQNGDEPLTAALQQVKVQAETAKSRPFATVMDKAQTPPSGDKHDFLSRGPYWWPDPETPDGLPYVRRDGLLNPDTVGLDNFALKDSMRDAEILALAYFYNGDETLAQTATQRLRAWFLDPATRMNPHLEYGQAIPGICEGRGIGIIDTVSLRLLPDVLEWLKPSSAWTAQDDAGLRQWMSDYLDWLLHSSHGQDEARAHNNHGTWYDVQVALLALAVRRDEIAQNILCEVPAKRLAKHLEADGCQPHELSRTRSFSYSCYNLLGLFDLATLAERIGLDLWSWRGENGATLRRALEFLAPYADAKNVWPFEQVVADDRSRLLELLRRGVRRFPSQKGKGAIESAERMSAKAAQLQLMWPL